MTKYYKGNIINIKELPKYNYSLNIARIIPRYEESYRLLGNTSHNAFLYYKKYSSRDLKKLVGLMERIMSYDVIDEEKKELDNTMIKIFNPVFDNSVSGYPIIYEKLYDQEGNQYGKELITGSIFPIKNKYSNFDVSYSSIKMQKVYYDLDNNMGYIFSSKDMYDYLIDFEGNKYIIYDGEKIRYLWQADVKEIFFDSKNHNMTVCDNPYSFNICISSKIIFPKSQRVEYLLGGEILANELEVNNYINRFETGFYRRKRKRQYEDKIKNYALSNYLGDINFVLNEDIVKNRVSESNITKEMQELEFLLYKLKSVSKDDYELLYKEYNELLNQNEDELHLNSLSINSIVLLQNKASLAFMCHGGNSKQIIAYLENQVNNYLVNYNNGSLDKTEISIKDLDRLSEYFLNGKNSYTIKEQNEILRCLSLLYFFEIYENRNVLNSNDLSNSYIADNIKRILVIIDILHEEGIIKSVPNSLYMIKSSDELLEFIQGIELNDLINEEALTLIKKMQQ